MALKCKPAIGNILRMKTGLMAKQPTYEALTARIETLEKDLQQRMQCGRQIQRIAAALARYTTTHGGLPTDADGRFRIPMAGFSQSLNISVAAAITLHHAAARRPAQEAPGTQEKRRALRDAWLAVARRLPRATT